MAEKKLGKRALRAQVEARREELSTRLADLLRALGLGASTAPELLALARRGDVAALKAGLARFAGNTEGDLRRRAEAETLLVSMAGLPEE